MSRDTNVTYAGYRLTMYLDGEAEFDELDCMCLIR